MRVCGPSSYRRLKFFPFFFFFLFLFPLFLSLATSLWEVGAAQCCRWLRLWIRSQRAFFHLRQPPQTDSVRKTAKKKKKRGAEKKCRVRRVFLFFFLRQGEGTNGVATVMKAVFPASHFTLGSAKNQLPTNRLSPVRARALSPLEKETANFPFFWHMLSVLQPSDICVATPPAPPPLPLLRPSSWFD